MINRQSSNGYIPSNDREQQNYLGGYGLSFRNIEEHKHIDKRLYTNIERMTLEEFYKLKYCSTVVYMVPRA